MKVLFRSLLAFFIFFWLFAFSSNSPFAQVLEQTFEDHLAQFRISTPNQQWKLEPRGIDPSESKLIIRFESALNQFVPNITIQVNPAVDPQTTLPQWVEQELNSLPKQWEVLEKNIVTQRGIKGLEILLRESENRLLFQQRFFLIKGKRFVVTCTAKEASYPRVKGDFIKILNSFEII